MALGDAPGLSPSDSSPEPGRDGIEAAAAELEQELPELPPPDPLEVDQWDVDVVVALWRARRDMGVIGKTERYAQGNTKYNFRGIDRVVNATRPILERHRLVILPSVANYQGRDVERQTGGRSHESIVTVDYHIYGPRGDRLEFPVRVVGEAMNTSDKDAASAQSVAWRVALTQILHIATGDPDPDSQHIDRGSAPVFSAIEYREEALRPDTSVGRLQQMLSDVRRLNKGGTKVENEVGDEETIEHLLWRVRKERLPQGEK